MAGIYSVLLNGMLMRLSDIVQPVPKTQPGVQGYISQQCMNMWVLFEFCKNASNTVSPGKILFQEVHLHYNQEKE